MLDIVGIFTQSNRKLRIQRYSSSSHFCSVFAISFSAFAPGVDPAEGGAITIGRGSTATVFLAASSTSGDLFAVKSAELSHSAILQREQSILSALSSPSIISSFGFDVVPRDGGALFYNLFLEYAPGGSLADHIKNSGGRLDEPAIRYKTRDILTGLAYLHGQGVVHCDVKPGNVLLVSGERAKIGDLGCARWVATGELEVRGTPMYMAPEAARWEEQGMSADVWSLGCTVIEMFTGRSPWPEIDDVVAAIHRIGFSGDVPEIPDWVSEEARDFLDKCLTNDPGERWTADELLRPGADPALIFRGGKLISNC